MTSVPSLSNNKQPFGDVYSPGYSILAQMIGGNNLYQALADTQ